MTTAYIENPVLKSALNHSEKGWAVFPLKTGGKTPATKNGFKDASTDPDTVKNLFGTGQRNLGVVPPMGAMVLDIDNKGGKNGDDELAGLCLLLGDLPPTRTVKTPSGGYHLYFTLPEGKGANIGQSNGALGEGLDIRANGVGYVVAPPSTLENGCYTIEGETKTPAELPSKWVEHIEGMAAKREKEKRDTERKAVQDASTRERQRNQDAVNTLLPGQLSPIDAFNGETTVPDMLAEHGYVDFGGRWLAQNSTSGMPGVNILKGNDGVERCYSHHSKDSDPLADGKAHDAFDVFCILEHGGDVKAATGAAAKLLTTDTGLNLHLHNRNAYRQNRTNAKAQAALNKPAHTDPANELLEELTTQAQSVTLQTYQDFILRVAPLVVDGTLDGIQREAIITALVNNGNALGGKRIITNALNAAEKQIKRDMQAPESGTVKGGLGLYSLTDYGVEYRKPTKDGYAEPVVICAPLRVLAETYDIADGNNGLLLEWNDTRGRRKTWAMPKELTAGDGMEVMRVLLSRGLSTVYKRSGEIIDYIISSPVEALMTCTNRTGWVDGVYVTPKDAYGENAESYIYQPIHATECKVGQAGTLAEWQAHVARYAQNNPLLITAISLAFAGTLLERAGMMGYGLHIHSGSSSGKTSTLLMSASCLGREFWQQWLSTSVGLEGSAYAHNDSILFLDEIGEATAQTVSATAYALANGEGKRRGGRDGNAKATKKWRLVFLSTGEYSFDHMMKAAGMVTRAGQEVRMISIKGDAWKYGAFNDLHGMANGSEFAEMLKTNTAKYYGTAADAWLSAITTPGGIPDTIVSDIDAIRGEFLPAGASGQVQRVARQFALIAYAGELATKHGVTGWRAGEATAAVKECFDLWVDEFGGADGNRETYQIIEAVKAFLFSNIHRFHDLSVSAHSVYAVKDRVGFILKKVANVGKEYAIESGQLTELAKGYSREQIVSALRTAGMINAPGKDGKSAVNKRILGETRRFFTITMPLVGDCEDDDPLPDTDPFFE